MLERASATASNETHAVVRNGAAQLRLRMPVATSLRGQDPALLRGIGTPAGKPSDGSRSRASSPIRSRVESDDGDEVEEEE